MVAIYAGLLRERGHEVMIVSQPCSQPSLKQRITSFSSLKSPAPASDGETFLSGLDVEHKILDAAGPPIDDNMPNADVIIATWWETAYWVASLSENKGRKHYFVQHHEVHNHLPWQISRGTYYLPLKKITISKWLVDTMAQEYNDKNVELVHNSVDMQQFHAAPRTRQKVPTVGLLYSPVHFKGFDTSLAALEKVRQQFPDLNLVVFGSHDLHESLPLPPNTKYHRSPAQGAIKDLYAACDVWLCGSRAEGFHLPPLEAMACRCPVVSTRVGGPMDIIEDGVNGYLVDVEDSQTLAERLIDVLNLSEKEWLAMSNAALAVAENYTWNDATDRLEAALMAEET